MSHAISRLQGLSFNAIPGPASRVKYFSHLPLNKWTDVMFTANGHLSLHEFAFREGPVLIGGVHLPSKLHYTDQDQQSLCSDLGQQLREKERRLGHQRTILLGDFNMDPFEPGIVSAMGFHAVMTRELAGKGDRKVNGVRYPFFYNPMWGRFGDTSPGDSAGTCHFPSAKPNARFWHVFDQILIRPPLLAVFDGEFGIAAECSGESLLDENGKPDKIRFSDHLPVFVKLSLSWDR